MDIVKKVQSIIRHCVNKYNTKYGWQYSLTAMQNVIGYNVFMAQLIDVVVLQYMTLQ